MALSLQAPITKGMDASGQDATSPLRSLSTKRWSGKIASKEVLFIATSYELERAAPMPASYLPGQSTRLL